MPSNHIYYSLCVWVCVRIKYCALIEFPEKASPSGIFANKTSFATTEYHWSDYQIRTWAFQVNTYSDTRRISNMVPTMSFENSFFM